MQSRLSPIRVIHADAIPLAVVRRRVRPEELGVVVPHECGVVWNFVRRHGLAGGRHVAVYLNGLIDVEVGVEVGGPFAEQEGVVRSRTPAGAAVTATHWGPYRGLGDAHAAIREWCAAQGHRVAGPNWEIYGHWQPEWDADPSSIRSDVFYQMTPVVQVAP